MGISEDRYEFNESGIRRLVKEVFNSGCAAYIRIRDGGWQGDITMISPCPGDGPYLLVRPGYEVLRYENELNDPSAPSIFRSIL